MKWKQLGVEKPVHNPYTAAVTEVQFSNRFQRASRTVQGASIFKAAPRETLGCQYHTSNI